MNSSQKKIISINQTILPARKLTYNFKSYHYFELNISINFISILSHTNFNNETNSQTLHNDNFFSLTFLSIFFFILDVNECNTLPRPCSGHGTCVNSVGSYFCTCYKDWEGKKCEKRRSIVFFKFYKQNSSCFDFYLSYFYVFNTKMFV